MMRPLIFIAYSILICSRVSGLDEEHRAAYNRLVGCISLATHVHWSEEHLNMTTLVCDAMKAIGPCLVKPLDSNSNTEILDFYRAFDLQLVLLANKENMCGEPVPYVKALKEVVQKSGIMEKENLPSVENDTYFPCEGVIRRKCYRALTTVSWRKHYNILSTYMAFIECYVQEASAPSCDFPITGHMKTFALALLKHLKEKHGLLGGMLEEIKQ